MRRTGPFMRMLVLRGLALSAGCGRTGLDLGSAGTMDVSTGAAGGAGTPTAASGGSSSGSESSGAPAGTPAPTTIPCGNAECVSGKQICCLAGEGHRRRDACVAIGESCPTDSASIACLDRSACGPAEFCCAPLFGNATMCAAPETCVRSPGVIVCASDADCPGIASHCCHVMGADVCSAQPCPTRTGDNGGGGSDGPGDTN
jgi:hypothetical protein